MEDTATALPRPEQRSHARRAHRLAKRGGLWLFLGAAAGIIAGCFIQLALNV